MVDDHFHPGIFLHVLYGIDQAEHVLVPVGE
jgi:hypothetical protein